MDEQNPFQVNLPLPTKDRKTNRSGRPVMKNMTAFGPQPKSIIAQMLSKIKTVSDDKDEIICIDHQSEESQEVERSIISEDPEEHVIKHKLFSCDFPDCSYSCKVSSNLIKHKRVHTNEKPYLCETCCFRSNFVNSLKVHKRTHTAERPYQCVHCSYKCNSSSNLKKHCRHRHPNVNDCQCGKTSS